VSENLGQLQLLVREEQFADQRRARQEFLRTAVSGESNNLAGIAAARGLVVRERENSIFSDAWVPLAVLFLIIGLLTGRTAATIALGTVLLLIVAVSHLWKNVALFGVTY